MTGARASVLVVAGDRDRGERYADWARERWSVVTVPDGKDAVAMANGGTEVVVVVGDPPDASLDWVVGQLHATDHTPQVVAVVDDPDEHDRTRVDDRVEAGVDRHEFLDRLERTTVRAAYRDRLREYYALASQKALMEARHSPAVLAESREYARLSDRAARRREQVDDLLAELSDDLDDFAALGGLFPDTVA